MNIYGETPLDELRQTISFAIWHAVKREVGAQVMIPCQNDCCVGLAPTWDADQWKAEHHDPELTKRRHLLAIRYAVDVGQDPQPWATNARDKGATWAEIGVALGVTKQAAQQRFGGPPRRPNAALLDLLVPRA